MSRHRRRRAKRASSGSDANEIIEQLRRADEAERCKSHRRGSEHDRSSELNEILAASGWLRPAMAWRRSARALDCRYSIEHRWNE